MLKDLWPVEPHPIKDLKRRELMMIRDALAKNRGHGTANQFVQVSSAFLNWALSHEWVETNVAFRMGKFKYEPIPAWTKEIVADVLSKVKPYLGRAILLALFTGQRRGDLCAMKWEHIRGDSIFVQQQKTGAQLWIPLHPALRAMMETWRTGCDYILTNSRGDPLLPGTIGRAINEAHDQGRIPRGYSIHGLRKMAAALLAEAGCSTHEIAAITGHASLKMVEHYTKSAKQERLAKDAINRLETDFWKPLETALQVIENK
ncbi:tyrosine-type recombinase/integrase [Kozakia baliensis]|uniref:tyrosine-type recombinase/integrase n=1 Tax=Kozakia baliensis TaxID=153496 RepID=UPI001F023E1D|nr:tyrosine-type recombinase/integrase [Kozakia baliensis]